MTDDRNEARAPNPATWVALLVLGLASGSGCAPLDDSASAGPAEGTAAAGSHAAATGGGGGAPGGGDGGVGGYRGGPDGGAGGAGGANLVCDGSSSRFVTEVVSVDYGPGQDFGRDQMPAVVYGPPRGAGCCGGSLDVVSLGNGGEIVVAFGANAIVDGPGPDFVVFENAFQVGGNPDYLFAEIATVAVSVDGQSWSEFSCTADSAPYGSCAGWHPVTLDGDDGPIDPASSGGDAFDLADVGVAEARYVRITDRPDLEGTTGVFDLDAVGIVNPLCF